MSQHVMALLSLHPSAYIGVWGAGGQRGEMMLEWLQRYQDTDPLLLGPSKLQPRGK